MVELKTVETLLNCQCYRPYLLKYNRTIFKALNGRSEVLTIYLKIDSTTLRNKDEDILRS